MDRPAARLIAFYLPQYHPTPENDAWWGRGFTEWTNVARAKPLFPGHRQPHLPADLGFYDLRVPETREAQAELAANHGFEGFCYYHYWFAGRRILERPFNEVLQTGSPRFPFCLCWANESWSHVWYGCPDKILIEQTYPGTDDYVRHFNAVLEALADPRYLTVDGRPLFVVYRPGRLPNPRQFTDLWRSLAERAGLRGLFFVGIEDETWTVKAAGFDGALPRNLQWATLTQRGWRGDLARLWRRRLGRPERVFNYAESLPFLFYPPASRSGVYPCVIPNWDNTPRSGIHGWVLQGSTPALFRRHLRMTLEQVRGKPADQRIVFVKAWNEWAEGNYMEPDAEFGRAYLEVTKEEVAAAAASQR